AAHPPGDAALDDQNTPSLDGSTPSEAAASVDGTPPSPDVCLPACVHGVCSPSAGYCSCDVGWAGPACDIAAPAPAPGMPVAGTVTAGQWAYYTFEGPATGLSATLTEDATVGLVWLYLHTNQTPDRTNYLKNNEDTQSSSHTVTRSFASPGTQLWYVAAYGQPGIALGQTVPYHVTITVIP
ncbi:MAG: hypothetical protein M3O50_04690, partial [Myxococcota bacterium]|nr:hypothetical protein [Myxococcota bacterium]